MSVRSFLDSNVLVYSDDHDSAQKQSHALDCTVLYSEDMDSGPRLDGLQIVDPFA